MIPVDPSPLLFYLLILCPLDLFLFLRADNSVVSGGIWCKFELIQAFMHVFVTCKNEEDPIKHGH